MKIIINGEQPLNVETPAKVIYENVYVPGDEDDDGQLHFTFTSDGLIIDVIRNGEVIATSCEVIDDMSVRLTNE